jgi:hypothetical protein
MPWPNFRPPPAPPAPAENQTTIQYGSAIVQYMIANDYTTASLTDEQIHLADHAINDLLARQARPDETIAPQYFEALNTARRRLTHARNVRAENRDRAERMQGAPAPRADDNSDGGQKEPRRPIAPIQPPPTARARPDRRTPQPVIDF